MTEGVVHLALPALAQRVGADLVVTGVRGEWLGKLLGSSTAQRARRRVAVPVLAVKREPRSPYRRLLWAVDPHTEAAQAAGRLCAMFPHQELHLLHACLPAFDGKLALAGVDEDVRATLRDQAAAKAMSDLNRFARETGLRPVELRIVMGTPISAILEHAGDDEAALTVLGPSSKSRIATVLLGSVVGSVVPYVPGDVLLV
jgi:nucleotide-binding universal stress UspA family protein